MVRLMATNGLVVWDTSVLTRFFAHLGQCIGAAVGVGVLILAVWVGIRVAKKIVEHFAK